MWRSWAQVLGTTGAKLYALVVGLVTTAATARLLGPDGRGIFVAAIGWVTLFSTVGYLSLGQVVIHRAAGQPPHRWLPSTLGSLLGIIAALTLVGWAAVAGGFVLTDGAMFNHLRPQIVVVAFLFLPFMLWVENVSSLLLALDALWMLNAAQIVAGTASVALVFVFLSLLDWGVVGAVAAFGVNSGLVVIACLAFAIRRAKNVRYEPGVTRELLGGGAKLHLNAVGSYVATYGSILIINHFRTPDETAYFQLAFQLINAMMVLPAAVSMVAYTSIAKCGATAAWGEQRRLMAQALALVCIAGIGAYLAAPLVIRLIGGESFGESVPLFRIMLLSIIGMTISVVMASQWIARGLFLLVSGVSLAVGCFIAGANFVFVPDFGASAAAWVTVAASAISIFINGGMALWVERKWRRETNVA